MPMCYTKSTSGLAIAFVGLCLPSAAPAAPPSQQVIRQWVHALDDDEFAVREAATENLRKAGTVAIEALVAAATGDSLEVTCRTLQILHELSAEPDPETTAAATAALKKLAVSKHAAAAYRARKALLRPRLEVVRTLEQAGAAVEIKGYAIVGVDLDNAKVSPATVALLRKFPELETLSAGNVQMDDDALAEVHDLPRLWHLNLYQSGVGDAGMKVLKGLPALRHVAMGGTKVTDAGLVDLQDLTQLEYLGLRADRVTDAGLVHLRKLTNLTGLTLSETQVTDAGLVHLCGMTRLTSLRLDTTGVTDDGLRNLAALPKLTELDLWKTKATEAGVARLKKALPRLEVVTRER
jgi:hypothetical protein